MKTPTTHEGADALVVLAGLAQQLQHCLKRS
jgi:hypothetical protein